MESKSYQKGFLPYALAAFLVGAVGGFGAVLGPAVVQDMNLPYNNTTWISLALAMSTAACAPILGKLGDAIGRKTTLLLGIALYGIGNAGAALAPSLPVLLIFRFVVGVGAAAIAPVVMGYIITEFPKDAMAKGFSLYMMISSGAVIFGPTLGSLIIGAWGWRMMLWICTGLSLATYLVCAACKEAHTPPRKSLAGFDVSGGVLVLIAFSLLLCVPSFGQNIGWTSGAFVLVLVGAVAAFAALTVVEKRAEKPILSGSFMLRKSFILSVAALFLTNGLMQANMTNTIVFVNYTQPENSLFSGYAISLMYLGMALGSVLIGPQGDKREPKYVLIFSLAITAIGCALMLLFSEKTPVWLLIAALGILGLGLGGNGTVFMKVVLSGLDAEAAGAGTGTYGLFRDLSAPFGVAVLVPLFTNTVASGIASGTAPAAAAVSSIRFLSLVEIACVAAGIAVVCLLPVLRKK